MNHVSYVVSNQPPLSGVASQKAADGWAAIGAPARRASASPTASSTACIAIRLGIHQLHAIGIEIAPL
jgi:hypothetical protein